MRTFFPLSKAIVDPKPVPSKCEILPAWGLLLQASTRVLQASVNGRGVSSAPRCQDRSLRWSDPCDCADKFHVDFQIAMMDKCIVSDRLYANSIHLRFSYSVICTNRNI
jgi:hypothetical protein